MKILITGNLGVIGSALCDQLEQTGITVRGFDIRYPKNHPFYGDIRDRESLTAAISGCAGVIHLAAVSRVSEAEQTPRDALEVNCQGTQNILDAMSGIQWLIFSSSREVYGEGTDLLVKENAPSSPVNFYGKSKLKAEESIRDQCQSQYLILRLTNVYGSPLDRPERLIPSLVHCAMSRKTMKIYGPERCFDFIHIKDICQGILKSVKKLDRNQAFSGETLNLTSGKGVTLSEVAARCREMIGIKVPIHYYQQEEYEVSRFVGDPGLARNLLDWQSEIPFEVGLNHYIQQIKIQNNSIQQRKQGVI